MYICSNSHGSFHVSTHHLESYSKTRIALGLFWEVMYELAINHANYTPFVNDLRALCRASISGTYKYQYTTFTLAPLLLHRRNSANLLQGFMVFLPWRRPQDSNLQALSGQLLSRQLPHHPDRRHILWCYINMQPPFDCPSIAFIICSAIIISFLCSSELGSSAFLI